jgi:hypothetical protein
VERDKRKSSEATWGRRIGIGIFWCAALHVSVMSTYSVVQQVFFLDDSGAPGELEQACAAGLGQLESELFHGVGQLLAQPAALDSASFLASWDARYRELPPRCGRAEPARRDLQDVRHRLETMLQDYREGQLPLRRRIHATLETLRPADAGSRREG